MNTAPDWKKEFLALLYMSRWPIIVATLLVFFAALAVALVYPPVFRASASILMKPPTGLEAARRAE
ncbi:MAG: hypothetical protein ACI9TH_003565, partial [Kiritimatiellia bacterium]